MSILIAIVLPFVYVIVALLVVMPAWKRAVDKQGSYGSAWVRTLIMGLPFILLALNRGIVYLADREVDGLCAKDGGVHVYETVTLGPENFGPDGTVFPQYELLAAQRPGHGLRYGPDYTVKFSTETLRDGRGLLMPRLTRSVIHVVRVEGSKLLAEQVGYDRYGGDPAGPWAASSHSCSSSLYRPGFERLVFINSGRHQ